MINELGCVPVDGHPSVFFHESWHILVVVYVDDILASGSPSAQNEFWSQLKSRVQLDDVEELSQFLGRFHHLSPGQCIFDMRDYAIEAVNLYKGIGGKDTVLRYVNSPFVSPGALADKDYESSVQIGHRASSILMKLLWLAKLSRPDLSFPICLLAGQIASWTRNADKQLFRLVCYVRSIVSHCLFSTVEDPPEACALL